MLRNGAAAIGGTVTVKVVEWAKEDKLDVFDGVDDFIE